MESIIYKYEVYGPGITRVTMLIGAEILTAQMQNGSIFVWVKVRNNGTSYVAHEIGVFGTGQPLDVQAGKYIATVQDGNFVWHIFDRGEIIPYGL